MSCCMQKLSLSAAAHPLQTFPTNVTLAAEWSYPSCQRSWGSGPSPRAASHSVRSPSHLVAPAFSTHASQLVKARMEAAHESELGREPSLNALTMTFESLGIGKNMQRLVILIASVTAALELFIWCEYVWNWWGRDDSMIEK
ncbi:hypothetical protein N7539_005473 [Penicillium diatomitis]|uniref:Uncharacterized protein n=1 Tax=Penicillium diatomitis TaxID=2819901 RepID=A0A9W9X885_9EURO|nr:uncharacterized protein N7539_005473 [Penicillium diatomitis]KAJ5485485.1 hypothetical protein N7539_005473 [Penicillium diatomitis]